MNVWGEMEGKFRKEAQKLDRGSTVKKMQIRETAKKSLFI